MKCCIDCFKDSEIREIIHKYGTRGNCDFCSAKNIDVYDNRRNKNASYSVMSI